MISFNVPYFSDNDQAKFGPFPSGKFSGDGPNTVKCHEWFNNFLKPSKTLLTTSCTHALEMMALLADIQPGDEVILPSYTFVSTASAFALRGAKLVFVDIRPDTMNIDEKLIKEAITNKTKAIAVVHYAGVSCEMDIISKIAKEHNLFLFEDAAQGMMAKYYDRPLGTLGHMGTYSFHETKNYHSGEGGLLIINDLSMMKNAEIVREKGTDRSAFLRGELDKYTWQMLGSSYLPSELNAAFLLGQLDQAVGINKKRLELWEIYFNNLNSLANDKLIELPVIPSHCIHNAHMFYIKTKDLNERTELIKFLKENKIQSASHYVPLHSSPAGRKYSRFHGEDRFTTKESNRLLRLPLHYHLNNDHVLTVCEVVKKFYKGRS